MDDNDRRQWLPNTHLNSSQSQSHHHPDIPPDIPYEDIINWHLIHDLQNQMSNLDFNTDTYSSAAVNPPIPPPLPAYNNNNTWLSGLDQGSCSGFMNPAHVNVELDRLRVLSAVGGQQANRYPPGHQRWDVGPGPGLGSGLSVSGLDSPVGFYDRMNNSNGNQDCLVHNSNWSVGSSNGTGLRSNGYGRFGFDDGMMGWSGSVNGSDRCTHNPNDCWLCQRGSINSFDTTTMHNSCRTRVSNDGCSRWSCRDRRTISSSNNHNHSTSADYYGSWENLRGKVALYVKDQTESEKMQKTLRVLPREGMTMVISEVKEDVREIMKDQFGSNFFQSLVDYCTVDDVTDILRVVMGDKREFLEISVHVCGTRAIQKLVRRLDVNNQEQKRIVSCVLKEVTVTLAKDTGGSHVLQELVKVFQEANDLIKPIVEEMINHVMEIAMDKSGCCVLNNCGEYIPEDLKERLLNQIISCASHLSEDRFGNYVVQHVIEKHNGNFRTRVIERLAGGFANLTRNKFGSHVVEKCLEKGDDEEVRIIITEIIEDEHFHEILLDQFGNFVIQTAIARSKDMFDSRYPRSIYKMLECRIMNYYPFLQSHPFGQRVLSRIKGKK